jgi:hypothetical protein
MGGTVTGVGVAEPVKLLRGTLRPSVCIMLFRWHRCTRDNLAAIDNKQLFCFLEHFLLTTQTIKYTDNASREIFSQ